MVKLLIIADDFTGALDTGVQFSKYGLKTQVISNFRFDEKILQEVQIVIINSNSRLLPSREAYEKVHALVSWAKSKKIEYIFKKTDSALRGNIGSELEAVVDVYPDENVYFFPAYPRIGRVVKNGTSYISGVLLEESVFSRDPYEPVTESYVPDIIKQQSDVDVKVIAYDAKPDWDNDVKNSIYVIDSLNSSDITVRLNELKNTSRIKLLAGCTALAEKLVKVIFDVKEEMKIKLSSDKMYIACGSLNEITKKQITYAGDCDFKRIQIIDQIDELDEGIKPLKKKIIKAIEEDSQIIVDTFNFKVSDKQIISENNIRDYIAKIHGLLAEEVLSQFNDIILLVTGGDTLMGVMNQLGINQIRPLIEIEEGVVVSEIIYKGQSRYIISKSGGFGTDDVFCRIAKQNIN